MIIPMLIDCVNSSVWVLSACLVLVHLVTVIITPGGNGGSHKIPGS
jgi:hypothetical protein